MRSSSCAIRRATRCDARPRARGSGAATGFGFAGRGLGGAFAAAGGGGAASRSRAAQQVVVVAEAQHQAAALDRERVRGERVDQRAVVRHEQHRAVERVDRVLERLAALDVEMVRGLVEHQHVRPARDQPGERQAAALAARQHLDLAVDDVAA